MTARNDIWKLADSTASGLAMTSSAAVATRFCSESAGRSRSTAANIMTIMMAERQVAMPPPDSAR